MTSAVAMVLAALVVLEIKHFVFDYPLQTAYMLKHKTTYGHPGGLIHAGLHVLGTTTVFLIIPVNVGVAAAVLAGEFVVHYHIDWGKGQLMRLSGLTTRDPMYWWGIGGDQLLHHLSYLAIAAILIANTGTAPV